MSDTTIRTAVYDAVAAVSNVGQVYDYQRWGSDYSGLLNLFKATISNSRVIRGWTVTSEGFTPEAVTLKLNQRVYRVKVRGFFGLDDGNASEKTAELTRARNGRRLNPGCSVTYFAITSS
jgi:hypothetical protein